MIKPIIKSKLAEGGQSEIFFAHDSISGTPLVIKACKSYKSSKYILMLKREYHILKEKLSGLDCVI